MMNLDRFMGMVNVFCIPTALVFVGIEYLWGPLLETKSKASLNVLISGFVVQFLQSLIETVITGSTGNTIASFASFIFSILCLVIAFIIECKTRKFFGALMSVFAHWSFGMTFGVWGGGILGLLVNLSRFLIGKLGVVAFIVIAVLALILMLGAIYNQNESDSSTAKPKKSTWGEVTNAKRVFDSESHVYDVDNGVIYVEGEGWVTLYHNDLDPRYVRPLNSQTRYKIID